VSSFDDHNHIDKSLQIAVYGFHRHLYHFLNDHIVQKYEILQELYNLVMKNQFHHRKMIKKKDEQKNKTL